VPNGRARQVLARFPAHLGLEQPGKLVGAVADVIATSLDEVSADLARVRRAHRLGDADTVRDLLLLGGLHGISDDDLGMLELRDAELRARVARLRAQSAGPELERSEAASAVLEAFGVHASELRLEHFAPESGDKAAAALRLAERAEAVVGSSRYLELLRARIRTIARIHAGGNATVRAMLAATANALDLDLDLARNLSVKRGLAELKGLPTVAADDDLFHSPDHFWHASFVGDRAALTRRVESPTPANRVSAAHAIIVVDLAQQMKLPSAALLAKAAELGIAVTRADASLNLADADALSSALGFVFERTGAGTVNIGRSLSVRELAQQLSLGVASVLARLAAIGVTGADPSSELDPTTVASAARKFGYVVEQTLLPTGLEEVIGVEENPLRRIEHEQSDCAHAERFSILRRGFGRVLLRTAVTGIGARTLGPMLVNRDEGRGVGFLGGVPDGKILTFDEAGRASLEGVGDVTASCFSFAGAVFADADQPHPNDFVLAGAGADGSRVARTITTQPAGALDRDAVVPHADTPLAVPGIGLGETRFAFFIAEAHASSRDATEVRAVTPRSKAGRFDGSVFAERAASAVEAKSPWKISRAPSARVKLSWLEHEAYAARILIPPRYLKFGESEADVKARVLAALERFRPLGVAIRVDVGDESWVLGEGLVTTAEVEDPTLWFRGGTVLSPPPPSP
jgi:hypothetical protein